MLNDKHGYYSINSLLICAQAALLDGTASNHDVVNLLDVAQDLISSTMNPFPFAGVSDKHANQPTPLHATCNGGLSLSFRIQLARENLGLSEAELARQLNTYSDYILFWERGDTEVPANMIIPLANALKCDPLWLLTGDSSIRQDSVSSEDPGSRHVSPQADVSPLASPQ
ncbi:TPA: helix-turn-helix domain-containing protein [Klebsiella michiganensis]|uniref:helix-turn-helix domain-containing protein n=1 Tax=Klebsiella TaxID=570 RepID=UPI00277C1D5A|nr:helix-turn-helix domain-containing protein [Klebsiella sp.]MDU7530562.1 helix-turn-helix domain-containing protein [Klebsiella sp.]HDS2235902.1 helix-turn-helix domain-containing protein [Klebsiella michiganensis]HDS8617942.1 helix-turn-helix domain-containing protein [Klebsiella michiganensis]